MKPWARRELLAGAGVLGMGSFVPMVARASGQALPDTKPASVSAADSAFFHQLDSFRDEILGQSPEWATQLGLDHGDRLPLRAQLGHLTKSAMDHAAISVRSMQDRLKRTDRQGLSPSARTRYDCVDYSFARALEGTAFSYSGGALAGLGGGSAPYVVSQQDGAISSIPEMLVSMQPVKSKADAEAYIARIAAFAGRLDEETALIKENGALGVIPPRFIGDNALGILKGFRATPAATQALVTNLDTKAKALALAGYGEQAARLMDTMVYPALDRQIAAFAQANDRATATAGVAHLPDGEAFYRWALRLGTTTTRSAEEIHRIGLEQNEEIKGRIDALLKAQGMTQGSVGARQALNTDPRQLYPDTDQGRAELIAYLEQRIATIRSMMPQFSHLGLKADVMVKRVPPAIQDGAARGYMQPAPLDGSRPAIYYLNLKSTTMWPRYQLATVTAHEGIPGHTWQLAYLAEHQADIPSITAMLSYNAFVEGWALYAEQLVDEGGLYDKDPWSRLGYLQAQQFRACRLVVDTGIHAMGWSRDKAIDFLSNETGQGRPSMTSEVDRYCCWPGQACGYKVGHNEIIRLREKTRKALGAKFDLAGYDDAVITTGGVPLELLEGQIDSYIATMT